MSRRAATFETRVAYDVEIRADDDGTGTFEGYACVFDQLDSHGTTFVPGCFTTGGLDERAYALLWMHQPWEPGGIFTAREDDHGLFISGAYDDTELGQAMRTRARSGSAPELSVGFIWRDSDEDDETAITSARLVETSQITVRMAAVPGAQISAVRSAYEPLVRACSHDVDEAVEREQRAMRERVTATRMRMLAL